MHGTKGGTHLVIPSEVADFLQDGLIMFLGTRNAAGVPECLLAFAARVEEPDVVGVFVAANDAGPTLANLHDNGRAALSMTRVTDDRSLQLKGCYLDHRPAVEGEHGALEPVLARRQRELAAVGIPFSVTARFVTWPAVRLRIRVDAIFEQTPGPHAGEPLSGRGGGP